MDKIIDSPVFNPSDKISLASLAWSCWHYCTAPPRLRDKQESVLSWGSVTFLGLIATYRAQVLLYLSVACNLYSQKYANALKGAALQILGWAITHCYGGLSILIDEKGGHLRSKSCPSPPLTATLVALCSERQIGEPTTKIAAAFQTQMWFKCRAPNAKLVVSPLFNFMNGKQRLYL